MDTFLSFLTAEVTRSKKHLGSDTGWTEYRGDNGLIISGGYLGNTEYLDSIQYRTNMMNPYNNYVNPFFIYEIMSNNSKEIERIEQKAKTLHEENKKIRELMGES